jgi:hypothetical protein
MAREAAAQTTPKFDYAKPEEVRVVEWKSQAKGGLLITTGNSSTTNGSVGASVSRKEGSNTLALEGNFAYGKSRITSATTPDTLMPTQVLLPAMAVVTYGPDTGPFSDKVDTQTEVTLIYTFL